MKVGFIGLLFISLRLFSQQSPVILEYRLELFENKIHVDLLFHPTEKDSSSFTYGQPAFGGQKDILNCLQNIEVDAPSRFKIDTANRSLTFYHHNIPGVKIAYEVVDTRPKPTTRSQLFRPMILPDYFFVHGVNLFLTPSFEEKTGPVRASVQWKTLPPFTLFYTFDPDNDGSHPTITTADSLAFRFMTGARDLTVKKFSSSSGENYLVLRSSAMTAAVTKEVTTFYLDYNAEMRRFWEDKRKINYSLVLQPYFNVDHPMSGISFGNGFIGKYNRPDSLARGERMAVIAHEIGHYYLGDVAAYEGEKNIGQWFNEGFNDYLTYFNLVAAGRLTTDEFDTTFNGIFQRLYTSPIKNTPNDKIFENFWLLGDYAKLPYWRGCLFALYLDNQISLTSKSSRSIRDLMLDLKDLVREKQKKEFTNEELIKAVAKYLPEEEFQKEFTDYIVNGSPIAFTSGMLLPFFDIRMKGETPILTITDQKKFLAHFHFN